jgi:uncharacterized protein (TIGR03437 family)
MISIHWVSKSRPFAVGAGACNGRWIAVCAALVVMAAQGHVGARRARAAQATGAQTEAAAQRLKTDGRSVSLATALMLTQQGRLAADDGAAIDRFGTAVAVSGDTAVIGAPNLTAPGGSPGAAYVFVRNGGTWTLQQKLTADDAAAGDGFGFSVAISGDTVMVGARGDDIGENMNQGSAYVFVRSGGVWTKQQKLLAEDGAGSDGFGFSIAVRGDTAAVGAIGKGGAIGRQGAAYVFTRSGTTWTQQRLLTADDGAAGDEFGYSVALSGDTVVVGSILDTIGGNSDQGSAYVFVRNGGNWTQQQKLIADDGEAGDQFGNSVAISGDTLVVGAPLDDIGGKIDPGSGYVFVRSGGTWTKQQKLTADDGEVRDSLGISAAVSGDTIVLGADTDKIGENIIQGSAYVFARSGATWTQQQKLTAADGELGDQFGSSVAISGTTVVVGAYGDKIGENFLQGSAYVFVSADCPTITLDPASLPDGVIGVFYSQTVTASGGVGPYQFSLSDGALPPGLNLSQNGQITGAPTVAGAYHFTITATVLSSLCPGSRSYTLAVGTSACNFAVTPTNHVFTPQGGNGVVNINVGGACGWTAASNDPFITINSGANGAGDGAVMFTVAANPNPGSRRGTLSVAGHEVRVAQAAPAASVSAASFAGGGLAAESIVAAFGVGLAKSTEVATALPLPTTLGGTRVSVLDRAGTERLAPLFFVSPTQINFQVPPGTLDGRALVMVIQEGETVAAGSPQIETVSPGLFSADASGQGLVIGVALRVKADNSQSFEPIARFDEEKHQFVAVPINLGSASDNVFLVLFGTGLRNRSSIGAVSVKIGGVNADALYAGPQGSFVGLDQLNVSLPRSLAGRGEVDLSVLVDGREANTLKVAIK